MNDRIRWIPYICLKNNCCVSVIESFPDVDLVAIFLVMNWFNWDDDIIYQVNNMFEVNEKLRVLRMK